MLDGSRYGEFFPDEVPGAGVESPPLSATSSAPLVLDPATRAVLTQLLRELQAFILSPSNKPAES